jgi:hypothetical protein
MKKLLWVIGSLLVVDSLVLAYLLVVRGDHYFPDRYEDGFTIAAIGGGLGMLLLVAFGLVYAEYRKPRYHYPYRKEPPRDTHPPSD